MVIILERRLRILCILRRPTINIKLIMKNNIFNAIRKLDLNTIGNSNVPASDANDPLLLKSGLDKFITEVQQVRDGGTIINQGVERVEAFKASFKLQNQLADRFIEKIKLFQFNNSSMKTSDLLLVENQNKIVIPKILEVSNEHKGELINSLPTAPSSPSAPTVDVTNTKIFGELGDMTLNEIANNILSIIKPNKPILGFDVDPLYLKWFFITQIVVISMYILFLILNICLYILFSKNKITTPTHLPSFTINWLKRLERLSTIKDKTIIIGYLFKYIFIYLLFICIYIFLYYTV